MKRIERQVKALCGCSDSIPTDYITKIFMETSEKHKIMAKFLNGETIELGVYNDSAIAECKYGELSNFLDKPIDYFLENIEFPQNGEFIDIFFKM